MTAAAAALLAQARRMDGVVVAIVAVFLGLAFAAPAQAVESAAFMLRALVGVSPFLVLSVVAAGAARATGIDRQIGRIVSGRTAVVIVAAALFGALSPLCSCGVIPVVAALLAAGVPLAPVMAFWISSPLMSVEKYILAAGVFDPAFATAYLGTAIALGLLAGVATEALVRAGAFRTALKDGAAPGCAARALEAETPLVWRFWRIPERRADFASVAGSSGLFLLKWLSLAFLVESLMVAYLPPDAVGRVLGGEAWWSVPASAAVGIPAYLNGFAAIPMVARLVEMGAAPGAALAFLTAGAVTSLPAAMGVFALVRVPVFILYLGLGLGGSLVAGLAYQTLLA